MSININGLTAFSYAWNLERDNQRSVLTAFTRALKATVLGLELNMGSINAMREVHPGSIFSRSARIIDACRNHSAAVGNAPQNPEAPIGQPVEVTETHSRQADQPFVAEKDHSSTLHESTSLIDPENPRHITSNSEKEAEEASKSEPASPEQRMTPPPCKHARPINVEDFSFLDAFDEPDTPDKKPVATREYFEEWFNCYGDKFVSHASPSVAEAYKSMLVEDHKLLCAEALCRRGFVNHEMGDHLKRGELKYDIDALKRVIQDRKIPVCACEVVECEIEERRVFQLYQVRKDGTRLTPREAITMQEQMFELAREHNVPVSLLYLTLDEMRDEQDRVDAALHKAYSDWEQDSALDKKRMKVFERLTELKAIGLGLRLAQSIPGELRFSPEKLVYWQYGTLIVLKGRLPESTLMKIQKRQNAISLLPENFGPQALENGGKLHSLDLHEKDVLILAPRSINGHSLEGLRSKMSYHNMVFYDEIPSEYANRLNVPQEVRSGHISVKNGTLTD